MPSYQKLQCLLTAPNIIVACEGDLQRKKIKTKDHLSMCNCSGGTELDKAVKFRISRSALVHIFAGGTNTGVLTLRKEARCYFRGWCTNLCAVHIYTAGGGGGRERERERIRCYTGVNSDLGNGSFGVEIRDAKFVDRRS